MVVKIDYVANPYVYWPLVIWKCDFIVNIFSDLPLFNVMNFMMIFWCSIRARPGTCEFTPKN